VGSTKGADDSNSVLVLGIHGIVEAADVGGGEFTSEVRERGTKLRESRERGLADDGDGVVRGKVVAVVFEGHEAEGVNEAVGGVTGHDVHLMIHEGAVDEAEVHDFGCSGKVEIVAVAPTTEAVGALEEFVADAGAPFGGEGRDIRDLLQVKILRVVAADDHGESVFEAEGLGDFEMKAIGVELLDAIVNGVRIALRGFVEDGGKGGAGVLDVEIEFTGLKSLVDEEGASEICFALDGDAGFSFDVLGKQLGEDHLLGKEFGADNDFRLAWRSAG